MKSAQPATAEQSSASTAVLDGRASKSSSPLLVGLDWGTNTSCLMAAYTEEKTIAVHELLPTVVGRAKHEVLGGVLPGDAEVLFGKVALKHKLHVDLVRPLEGGVIADKENARLFAQHLRDRLPVDGNEVRAVIGMPASSDLAARENARTAVQGVFNKVIFVPEPFLAALGYRDESKLSDPDYLDPVLNSLYVDIGAGSTDVCLVQGTYPTMDDQLSVPFAGDAVDKIIRDGINEAYPDAGLSLNQVRTIKEKHSWVLADDASQPAVTTIMVGGKPRQIDVTRQVGVGCETLLNQVFAMAKALISKADPESVNELLGNVIVTGGGSLIKGFGVALQTKLLEEGFSNPRVTVLGENYKEYVAQGALTIARRARENQWQSLLG